MQHSVPLHGPSQGRYQYYGELFISCIELIADSSTILPNKPIRGWGPHNKGGRKEECISELLLYVLPFFYAWIVVLILDIANRHDVQLLSLMSVQDVLSYDNC